MDDGQIRSLLARAWDQYLRPAGGGLDTAQLDGRWFTDEEWAEALRWARERGGRGIPEYPGQEMMLEVPVAALSEPTPTTGPLRTVLDFTDAATLRDFTRKPTDDVIDALASMPLPPSEALLGAVLLHAVDDLRAATNRLDAGTDNLVKATMALIVLAALTLAASIVTLIVTIAG